MKKIALLLSLILALSIFSVACGSSTDEKSDSQDKSVSYYNDGVHYLNYTETDDFIIKDGESQYKILIDRNCSTIISDLVYDFTSLFLSATGVNLPVVYTDQVYFDANSRFISIGKNAIFQKTGIKTDEYDLDKQGFIIKTFYKSIFIAGDYDLGTVYGAYQFLSTELNFDCFSNITYHIDTGIKNLSLKNYNFIDVPDFKYRKASTGFIINSPLTLNRMRMTHYDYNYFASSEDIGGHTSLQIYVKKDLYLESHPDWFSTGRNQICYTAHGNAEEKRAMQEMILEKFKDSLRNNPDGYVFAVSQEDNPDWCGCDACKALKEQYETDSASVIKFMNELAQMLRDWMETEEGKPYKRYFVIRYLVYEATQTPPVNYDPATKTYVPKDESVICDPNTRPIVALGSLDYQQSLFHSINESFLQKIDGWSALSNYLDVWKYQTNFNYYLMPYDVFSTTQEFYQYVASKNTYFLYDEGISQTLSGATGWTVLKSYLCSKLAWDVNADLTVLTDKFFENCYDRGSESMRKFFDEYRVHSRDLINNYKGISRTNSIWTPILFANFWPKNLIDRWLGYVNEAINDIEYLKKVDMEKYQNCYDCIVMERVSLYFMISKMYSGDSRYSAEFINKVTEDLDADCIRLGIKSN